MDLMRILLEAIGLVREPSLFRDERGYQGELKSKIDRLIDTKVPLADFSTPLVQEEYQKRAERHGITLRPDLIIHVPFERGVSPTRKNDNYMVILLKRSAGWAKAKENFSNLEIICSGLNYPVGISINVASSKLWLPKLTPKIPSCFTLHEIAVKLVNGTPSLKVASRQQVNRKIG
jgi:hypothetical protein